MVAGMAGVTGPKIVAAASNCGGIGTIGAIGLSPEALKKQIVATKALLNAPDLPFGVDLLLPKVGKGAKKTNKDYTGGKFLLENNELNSNIGELFTFSRFVTHEITPIETGTRYSLHFAVNKLKSNTII